MSLCFGLSFFLYLSKVNWAKQIITNWKFAWRTATRFVAGEKLEDAISAIKVLNTHDNKRVEYALNYAKSIGYPQKAMAFQMQYGIRRDLLVQLAAAGHPVRLYVPYGTQWYP